MSYKTFTVGSNAKTIKGDGDTYETAITYMKPYKTEVNGKVHNLCALADKAKCHVGCLHSAGRGQMNSVQQSRANKTEWFIVDKIGYIDALINDLTKFSQKCERKGIKPCVRLNGTSDIQWEKMGIMEQFPNIQFYDYTKIVKRAYAKLPSNYHLTLSYSEADMDYAESVYKATRETKTNMAVVFRNKHSIPKTFRGLRVVDGDKDDLRFLDPKGVVVALYAKGKATKDDTGFVIDVA